MTEQYREAVTTSSPGLPRFAATLGNEDCNDGPTLKGLWLAVWGAPHASISFCRLHPSGLFD